MPVALGHRTASSLKQLEGCGAGSSFLVQARCDGGQAATSSRQHAVARGRGSLDEADPLRAPRLIPLQRAVLHSAKGVKDLLQVPLLYVQLT